MLCNANFVFTLDGTEYDGIASQTSLMLCNANFVFTLDGTEYDGIASQTSLNVLQC